MNNLRGAKIIYQESKATQPSHLYFLQKDSSYCEAIVTSESGAKRKLNFNVDLSNYYTKNETYSKIEVNGLLDAIEVTKTELDDLISENKLEPNRLYKITWIESWCFSQHLIKAIYLKAITNNTLESEGVGEFYTPKYNTSDSNLGIWKGELLANGMISSASYNIGDKVIWGNLFWENISGNIGNNNYVLEGIGSYKLDNYLSETDWQLITPNDDESLYNIQFDFIKFDLENDYIYYREDELNNKYELPYNILLEIFPNSSLIYYGYQFIYNINSISLFQWGRSNVNNNFIKDSIVLNCNYTTSLFIFNNFVENSKMYGNNFLNVNVERNTFKNASIVNNYLKTYGGLLYNNLDNSYISSNRYYFEISYNKLKNNSSISNNNDNNIIVNINYSIIKGNSLDNNSTISNNIFIEEGKGVSGYRKGIYDNVLTTYCNINSNTIKNSSRIFGHTMNYFSTINGNTLDTDSNIYNNQLVQNGKIDNNILTGHGRIYGNQLDRQSEITNCKLRISPATSYATTMKSNRLFAGKIQNVDFGNIVNPVGSNPNDPAFGGNGLSECIIENESIIKDLTFPNHGGVGIQFVKMNGFSELKNLTVSSGITSVEFINTVFDETSDYSKLIEGAGYNGQGFTKFYIDNKLVVLSKLNETFLSYTGANKDVNIGAHYFESSQGFKKTNGTANQSLTANGGTFDLNTKADLVGGKVPSSQLPSYVDDVLEGTKINDSIFNDLNGNPYTPESGKLYVDVIYNKTYRWSGSVYASTNEGIALGETSSTAYRGDRGKIAYDHSQVTHDKTLVGLGNVDNTSDLNKPISTATQTALNLKLSTEAPSTTGTVISFSTDKVYGTLTTPETGNITADVTNAKLGVTNIIIHNSGTAPTFGSEFKKLSGSGNYTTGVVNYIYCTYISTTEIIYSINQRA